MLKQVGQVRCELDSHGGESGGNAPADALPEARSPPGCQNPRGKAWGWSQRGCSDGRTGFANVPGGSFCEVQGPTRKTGCGPQSRIFA